MYGDINWRTVIVYSLSYMYEYELFYSLNLASTTLNVIVNRM